jgi:hypothetical protein
MLARHWSDASDPNDTDRSGPVRAGVSRSMTSASQAYCLVAVRICWTVALRASSHTEAS